MTDLFSADEAVAMVARLTHARLASFVQARIVAPTHAESGLVYRRLDIVRMELLCELSDQFDLEDDALGVVISLIDQLHGVRAELKAVVDAIAQEPAAVRGRVRQIARAARSGQ
jgi:chaperone modulatory protein CbpM